MDTKLRQFVVFRRTLETEAVQVSATSMDEAYLKVIGGEGDTERYRHMDDGWIVVRPRQFDGICPPTDKVIE